MRIVDRVEGFFHYLIAVFMVYAGVATILAPVRGHHKRLSFIYDNHNAYIGFGITFIIIGLSLITAKILRSLRWTDYAMQAVFAMFVFAAVLNAIAVQGVKAWIFNALCAILIGLFHIRLHRRINYVDAQELLRELNDARHPPQ